MVAILKYIRGSQGTDGFVKLQKTGTKAGDVGKINYISQLDMGRFKEGPLKWVINSV